MKTQELKQAVDCPVCGWTNLVSDSMSGLGAIQRRCYRNQCREFFLAVYRGVELVGSTRLRGHTPEDYRAALNAVQGLGDDEVDQLVTQAEERAEKLGRYERAC